MPAAKTYASPAEKQRAYRERQKMALSLVFQAKGMPSPSSLATLPSSKRWRAIRDQAEQLLSTMLREMESYQADRSEAWLNSGRAEDFQENIELVEEAIRTVQDIIL